MDNAQRMALVMNVYNLMFNTPHTQWRNTPMPQQFAQFITRWVPQIWANGAVRAVEIGITSNGRLLPLKFLEQNPNKLDHQGRLKETALRAQNGERIMWIIDARQQNGFLGSVQNGQWQPSKSRAYQPVQQNYQAAGATGSPQSINNVADIPGNMSVPEYVVETLAEEGYPSYDPESYDRPEDIDDPYQ